MKSNQENTYNNEHNSIAQPWVNWCINHNLEALVLLVFILLIPLYYLMGFMDYLLDVYETVTYDFKEILKRKE